MRFLITVLAGALVLCFVPTTVAAKPLEEKRWREVRTDNFTILSALGKSESRKMARHIELMRAAALQLTTARDFDPTIPTLIIALRRGDYENVFGLEKSGGIFLADPRQNIILVKDSTSSYTSQTIKHEFIHQLMNHETGLDYPKWYIEGFASYFDTSEIRGNNYYVGVPGQHGYYVLHRPWIEIETLISPGLVMKRSLKDIYSFYSLSWLLVHYLNHAADGKMRVADWYARYSAARRDGKSEIDAFTEAFEIGLADLELILKEYARKHCCEGFKLPLDELLPEFDPQYREPRREEVALSLARVAFRLGNNELAKSWYDVAMEAPDLRADALAFSALMFMRMDSHDEAKARIAEATALAPENSEVLLTEAQLYFYYGLDAADRDVKEEYLRNAQQSLLRAWKLNPDNPLIYALTGRIHLILDERPHRAVEMLEHSVALAPSVLDHRFFLAQAYANVDRYDEALFLARSYAAAPHLSGNRLEIAQKFIASIEAKSNEQQ